MAQRTFLSDGSGVALSKLLPPDCFPPTYDYAALASRVALAVAAGRPHVEPAFLSGALLNQARGSPPALGRVVAAIDALRAALSVTRPLLQSAELSVLTVRGANKTTQTLALWLP